MTDLAWLLNSNDQLDAAEEAASRAIDLLPEKGEEFQVCQCHQILGLIYQSKGEIKEAIHRLEVALEVASSFNWLTLQCRVHYSLASLFSDEGRFDDAQTHVEHAKLRAVNCHHTYLLSHTMWLQAEIWMRQRRFAEAKSEASRAIAMYEKLGATDDVEGVRELLQQIDNQLEEIDGPLTPNESDDEIGRAHV